MGVMAGASGTRALERCCRRLEIDVDQERRLVNIIINGKSEFAVVQCADAAEGRPILDLRRCDSRAATTESATRKIE